MNMKQMKAAAPDLLGTPSYYPDGTHHRTLIGQLKDVGMMPVAWAMEEQAERITDLEEQVDKLETAEVERDAVIKSLAAVEEELDRYKGFFRDVREAFEAEHGRWICAEPDDDGFIEAVQEAFEKD